MVYYNPYKHWVVSPLFIAEIGIWDKGGNPLWEGGASTTTSSMKVRWLPGENDLNLPHDFGISNEESDINSFFNCC